LGKVSEAEELSSGQWDANGDGDVGVMRPGRGVSGEEGKEDEASRSNIWRMLWMTSPAPAHRSARSFLDRKQSAFPAHRAG
jgi:redox-sensitive bicupin YhaK (pirin superfamily)